MQFNYKVRTSAGKIVEGVKEAPDRFTLAREMRTKGDFIISAWPVDRKKRWSFEKINNIFNTVKLRDKIVFANNLSVMIAAGLSLSRSLNVLERQTNNRYFKIVIKTLEDKISQGENLSTALKSFPKIFPEVFVAMVAAGEESGDLPKALKVITTQMQKSYDLRKKIRGAMIYPSIIIGVIIIIGILMMIFLIPTLTATFKELNVELPFSTKVVIAVSDFFVLHGLISAIIFLILLAILIWFIRRPLGQRWWHYLVLRLPVIGYLAKEFNTAVIMRTTSALITAGVSMIETLRITDRVVQNVYYKKVMVEAVGKVQKGIALSVVLQTHEKLFPVLAGEMVLVGEETGDLPGMLMAGAVFFEDEVDQATKNLSTIIEPVLMIFIGLAVGFFAISMIGPLYSLSDAI